MDKYAEAEGVVETVIKIFSERTDPTAAREAGREIAEIKRRVTERHASLVQSIRGTPRRRGAPTLRARRFRARPHRDHSGLRRPPASRPT